MSYDLSCYFTEAIEDAFSTGYDHGLIYHDTYKTYGRDTARVLRRNREYVIKIILGRLTRQGFDCNQKSISQLHAEWLNGFKAGKEQHFLNRLLV